MPHTAAACLPRPPPFVLHPPSLPVAPRATPAGPPTSRCATWSATPSARCRSHTCCWAACAPRSCAAALCTPARVGARLVFVVAVLSLLLWWWFWRPQGCSVQRSVQAAPRCQVCPRHLPRVPSPLPCACRLPAAAAMIPNPFSVLYASTKSFLSGQLPASQQASKPRPALSSSSMKNPTSAVRPSRRQAEQAARPPGCAASHLPAYPCTHPRPWPLQPLAPRWRPRCGRTASTCLSFTPPPWPPASTTRQAFCRCLATYPTHQQAGQEGTGPARWFTPRACLAAWACWLCLLPSPSALCLPRYATAHQHAETHHTTSLLCCRPTSWTLWSSLRSLRLTQRSCQTRVGGGVGYPSFTPCVCV